jgi:hypothetical protein
MKTELEKQIELLKKYNITNYTITDNIITVNGSVYLSSLTSVPNKDFLNNTVINGYLNLQISDRDFLKNTVINGSVYLDSLTSIPKDFLNNTVINGTLYLSLLTSVPKDFLSNVVINGNLYLRSLTSIPKDFLNNTVINGILDLSSLTSIPYKHFLSNTVINGTLYLSSLTSVPYKHFLSNTVINGSLDLSSLKSVPYKDFLSNTVINGILDLYSLTSVPDKHFLSNTVINGSLYLSLLTSNNDRQLLNSNVKKLKEGYNKEKGYCYFDNILSKVLTVSNRKGYVIYVTPSGYITQKGNFTAHGTTVKKSIEDLEFKIISEKLKKDPIYPDTVFTVQYYRTLTGACEEGCKQWLTVNNMNDVDSILAKDLLPILEKSNAYGVDKFKQLITF